MLNMDNDESRRVVEQCYRTNKTSVNPIVDWQDEDVWEFIRTNNLPYCELYDEGYDRLGCIGCPMKTKQQRERDFARWPVYKKLYIRAFDEMIKNRTAHGLSNQNWENGEQCLAWWLNETSTRQLEGQMRLDDLEEFQ